MKRNPNTSNLTKNYIESKISQELIVSKYLDIPLEIVKHCIKYNKLIPSVFRDDDKIGSMGIQYNAKGRLKVRDFGGFGFFEDIYGVVAYVLSLAYERKIETNNKSDFYFILKHIAYTFRDIIDGKEIDPEVDTILRKALYKSKNSKAIIEIVPRSWNKFDKKYWNGLGIDLSYLNTHFVIPVEQYYINRGVNSDPKYYYKEKDPCYAYMLGQNRAGIYLIKLYFPLRNRHTQLKFITNASVLEGLPNLELDNYDYILITKSSKDRLSIGCKLSCNSFYGGAGSKLNIGVINLPSENYKLNIKEYDYIVNKLKPNGIILSLLDFDYTGRCGAKYLKDNYDIPYLFITNGQFGLYNYGCKDFSELYEKYSNAEINKFIKETIKYVEIKYREETKNHQDANRRCLYNDDLPY